MDNSTLRVGKFVLTIVGVGLIVAGVVMRPQSTPSVSAGAQPPFVPPVLSPQFETTSQEVVYPATEKDFPTGVQIHQGDLVTIDAVGEIMFDPTNRNNITVSPDGAVMKGESHVYMPDNLPNPSDFVAPKAPVAALVGYIGYPTDMMVLGSHTEFTSRHKGELFVEINDRAEWFGDNTGSIRIRIEVKRPKQTASESKRIFYPTNVETFDTGIDVTQGQTVTVSDVSGGYTWAFTNMNSDSTKLQLTAKGASWTPSRLPPDDEENQRYPFWSRSISVGALIMLVKDSSNIIPIGYGTTFTAPAGGRIYLATNTRRGRADGNSGSFQLNVSVR